MAEKKYDLVVYGASGFTGQYVVDEVARVAHTESLTWAIAGRNMAKLQKVLSESSARTGKNLEETPILIADSSSPKSLEEMATQAKVVLNCVGPYRFYGEPVVKACLEQGTHHLDISGEPQFLEKMQLLYNGKAREKNTFIIGAAGFDSVPADAGILFMEDNFQKGRLTNIESFCDFKYGPNGLSISTGTLESAAYAVPNMHEMNEIQGLLYPQPLPENEFKIPKRVLYYEERVKTWCVPFIGVDETMVHRTLRDHLSTNKIENPFQYLAYVCMPNVFAAVAFLLLAGFVGFMSYFSLTRALLLKFPRFFTLGTFRKGGPTKEQIDAASFSMVFVGRGFESTEIVQPGSKPNRVVMAKLTGPAAYVTTAICIVQCGVAVLKEKNSLPHKGGVMTVGSAFSGTNFIQRLEDKGLKFSLISDTMNKL